MPEPAPAPAPVPAPAAQPYRITTLHPRTYNEARQIGESFRDGMPVIMNLTEMNDADAKRLVDFAAGLSFGLRGSIERVTNKVFLLSPRDVDVTAEDKARIREGGFLKTTLCTSAGVSGIGVTSGRAAGTGTFSDERRRTTPGPQ